MIKIPEEARLKPIEILQARLDYAHHIKKAGIKNGSYDDVRALENAIWKKAIPLITSQAQEEERKRMWQEIPRQLLLELKTELSNYSLGKANLAFERVIIKALKEDRDSQEENLNRREKEELEDLVR